MKTGIITWWRNNYGSILQAYALQQVLNEFDDVEYEIKRTMNESGEEIYKIEVENEHDYEFVVCYKKVTNEDGSISFVSM